MGTTISGTNGASSDIVCSFLPQDGSEGPVLGAGYCASAFSITDRSEWPEYRSRQRSGVTGRHFRDLVACLRHSTTDLACRAVSRIGYVFIISPMGKDIILFW